MNYDTSVIEKPINILRRKQVEHRTGLARATMYELIKTNEFPKPIKLSTRNVGWIESEIQDWLIARVTKTRGVEESKNED